MSEPPKPKCAVAPVFVAFLEPFRLVIERPDDAWYASFEQLSNRTYDYLKLNRVSQTIDCDVCGSMRVHFGYDGSLILIGIEAKPEAIVDGINQFLGELLLGGVFTEAVDVDSLDRGIIYQTGYVRTFGLANSPTAKLLHALRSHHAGSMQVGCLERPKQILGSELVNAWAKGSAIHQSVSELSLSFVLLGVSAHSRHDWQAALSNLWIAIEQCTAHLWTQFVVSPASQPEVLIDGRVGFLRDTRAWTLSTRHELLFQIGIIDSDTYKYLATARKARNRLAHEGTGPKREDCTAALTGCFRLISIACTPNRKPDSLLDLVKMYQDQQPRITVPPSKERPQPRPVSELEPGFWLKLPALPGDEFWEGPEYPNMFAIDPLPSRK